ncbi:MAG: cellobiose phosphorylase [Candidatus Omnitrophota bacterium]
MKKSLWKFTDDLGSFISDNADKINTLYFPLCNSFPFMSSITPSLHGDIKTGNNSFLMEPVSRIGLSNSKISRNFWIYINPQKIWSATGVSKDIGIQKYDTFKLEAGLLWHKTTRENKKMGLKAEITSFVPSSNEPVEIMLVNITNISAKTIKFTPAAAIPIYARSSNNLRDHRHVTSLLNRIKLDRFGVIVTPTLLFDETGHKKNKSSYFVFALNENSGCPQYIYPAQEEFCGEDSDLEAPAAIFKNRLPDKKFGIQGKEAIAGLKFQQKSLKPKQSYSYIVLMGIVDDKNKIMPIFSKFNDKDKVIESLEATKTFWQKISVKIQPKSCDKIFDNWFRWISIQPFLRKIFGCSFLPDFDYGRGGRGWRDSWQDCLSLILTDPLQARSILINNFKGVRIDGSNATIIGEKYDEFIADRNNISRVWMDHGIWPLITTLFYIHQSSDIDILLEQIPYFKDQLSCRGHEIDSNWTPVFGNELKTASDEIYKGSVLEHILVENLVQFFNVGPHNHIRLENADWNDGLDMAAQYGESVAFTAMYAKNLKNILGLVEHLKQENIEIHKELTVLLDSLSAIPIDYSDIGAKQKNLENYFYATKHKLSGEKISIAKDKLIDDLKKKADWIFTHIQENEWLDIGFYNGYYNNDKEKLEGKINDLTGMTLTGQAFPVMSGIATPQQIEVLFKNAKKYLQDKEYGGFRLNTDFKDEQLNLGRAFSFIYGDKENGAFFNHMTIMFAYALYSQRFAREGFEVLNSIYKMSLNTSQGKIYPCIPEYFNDSGRGMYSYLTGSASWFILTMLTQVFGVRGEYGDLVIEPKLIAQQFQPKGIISINTFFAEKSIEVKFINPKIKDFGEYHISMIKFNAKIIAENLRLASFSIKRQDFLLLSAKELNLIEVYLT